MAVLANWYFNYRWFFPNWH